MKLLKQVTFKSNICHINSLGRNSSTLFKTKTQVALRSWCAGLFLNRLDIWKYFINFVYKKAVANIIWKILTVQLKNKLNEYNNEE